MLDLEQLRKDLPDLLAGKKWSVRDAGNQSGVGFGKLQRFLSGTNRSLNIDDVATVLESCGTTLVIHFGRIDMLKELDTLNEDAKLIEKFKRALKVPANRQTLKAFLDGLVPDELQSDKNGKERRARRPSHAGGRGEG